VCAHVAHNPEFGQFAFGQFDQFAFDQVQMIHDPYVSAHDPCVFDYFDQ
jgi:hypothetical protein